MVPLLKIKLKWLKQFLNWRQWKSPSAYLPTYIIELSHFIKGCWPRNHIIFLIIKCCFAIFYYSVSAGTFEGNFDADRRTNQTNTRHSVAQIGGGEKEGKQFSDAIFLQSAENILLEIEKCFRWIRRRRRSGGEEHRVMRMKRRMRRMVKRGGKRGGREGRAEVEVGRDGRRGSGREEEDIAVAGEQT